MAIPFPDAPLSPGDRPANYVEYREPLPALTTDEAAALLTELRIGARKVMGRCTYEQKQDAISEAFTKMLEMRAVGRDYPIAYWIGCMRMRARIIHSARQQKKNGRPIAGVDENGEEFNYLDYIGAVTPARQFGIVAAREALASCLKLPKRHKAVILRRADGANPVEIAAELQLSLEDVLLALSQTREWLEGEYV